MLNPLDAYLSVIMDQFHLFVDEHQHPEVTDPELEIMKDRFAKLLLGEDMSGGGKGVNTAVTISNAITNLYGSYIHFSSNSNTSDVYIYFWFWAATVFGHNLRLEPMPKQKRVLWRREMDCRLSVCDYMVETHSSSRILPNGTTVEVMMNQPRSDIYLSLPALHKLEAMLIEILDSFQNTEFWYEEEGSRSSKSGSPAGTGRGSRTGSHQRKEDKWWLPVPCVPPTGLSEGSRKSLRHKRDCASQIHKAAKAINGGILSEMDIPDSYTAALPKSGKSSLGESTYKQIYTPENFSANSLLDGLNITSEHEALELADKVEASMYTWRRKAGLGQGHSKSSWELVKDFVSETEYGSDKNTVLAERAESLLFCLRQRFPELSQTSLDICKIQYNQDVVKAILESYSRVLEGLAFNIISWIDQVLSADHINASF